MTPEERDRLEKEAYARTLTEYQFAQQKKAEAAAAAPTAPAPEEQIDPLAMAKGAGAQLGGIYNTLRHPLDTMSNVSTAIGNTASNIASGIGNMDLGETARAAEPAFRTIGKGALGLAGAGAGFAVGGPIGMAAGATAGTHLFDKLNQATGSDEVTSPTQDVNSLMYNFGGNAVVPAAAQVGSRIKNAILPSKAQINWKRAQGEAPAANILNMPGKETDARIQFTEQLGQKQDAFLEAKPFAGIDPNDPTAWKQFRQNMRQQTTDAKVVKYNKIGEVDEALEAGDAPLMTVDRNTLASHIESMPPENRVYVTQNQINAAQNYIDQNFTTAPVNSSLLDASGRPIPPSSPQPIPHNLSEAQNQMGIIDNALKRLKAMDVNAKASNDLNPSVLAAQQDQIDGLGLVKGMLSRTMKDTANLAVPGAGDAIAEANRTISSLVDYQKAARIRGFQASRGTSPQAPGSLNTNVKAGSLGGINGAIEAGTGGIIDNINARRRAAASQKLLPEDLRNLQNLEGLIGSKQPGMLTPESAASYQAMLSAVQPLYQPPAPPLLSRDFDQVKKDPAQWSQVQQAASATLGVDVTKMPEIPQKQVFQQLLQVAPQIATPPATGYQTAFIDKGVTRVSGMDKSLAMQQAATETDPVARAMKMGALMKDGTLITDSAMPGSVPVPAPAPNPMAPLGWLNEQEPMQTASAPIVEGNDSDNMLLKMFEAAGRHVQ